MNIRAVTPDFPPEVADAFASAAITALQELTQLAAARSDRSVHETAAKDDSVVALLRLLRSAPGALTLVLPLPLARRLAEGYLPSGTQLTDEIINDVAGELANVIAGQAKTILKGTPYHFTLSLPVVSRHAPGEELRGVAIPLSVETSPLWLLVDLSPCSGA